MDLSTIFNSEIYTWVIIPLLIFFARILDVSIGTIRIIFVSRNNKLIAPILGFFEVLIWLLAIQQVMQNLNNVFCYLAYASGFAMGNLLGICIEEKLAVGKVVVRIITQKSANELVLELNSQGYGVTNIPAEGSRGKVNVVYTIIERHDLEKVIDKVNYFNPKAFYTIEDIRSVKEGVFPGKKRKEFKLFKKPHILDKLKLSHKTIEKQKEK
ncbi:MAG: DUF2179 domain-containing protein [Ignavibacteriales bacterium]|nr:DUF2179 domain-containing protein [Ignavibacteriales bacterium]